jgi:cation transport ATPase
MTSSPARPDPAVPNAARLTAFVDGMDCASWVQKVERLVGKRPGAAAVQTSSGRQTLALDLDEARTGRAALERNPQALGCTPSLLRGAPPAAGSGAASRSAPPAPVRQRAGQAGRPFRPAAVLARLLGFRSANVPRRTPPLPG